MTLVPDPAAAVPAYGTAPSGPYPTPPAVMDQADIWPSLPTPMTPAEVRTKRTVLTFDGRVLEIFGALTTNEVTLSSGRWHVGCAHLEISEPDRIGRRAVKLFHSPDPWRSQATLTIEAEDWATVGPFFLQVAAAFARG